MIQTARAAAAAMIVLRQVLERRSFVFWRLVFDGIPVEFEDMAKRIFEPVGPAVAQVTFGPADAAAGFLDGANPTLERFRRRHPIGDMADAGRMVTGELQRVKFVVVPGAQVGAIAVAAALRQAVNPGEEVETVLEAIGIDLDMPEMGDIVSGFRHVSVPPGRGSVANISSRPSFCAQCAEWRRWRRRWCDRGW